MRYLLIGLIMLTCVGCGTTKPNIITLPTNQVDCTDVQPLYWGNRGVSPADNKVWLCYDWIITSKDYK
jgi:hypothetical protein